jgi:formamidopyrimidine-DNA glycosylase
MPELPEVETVSRSLKPFLLNKTIRDVKFLWPGVTTPQSNKEFLKHTVGQKIIKLSRVGKYMFWKLSNGYEIVVHLRMTGQFLADLKMAQHLSHERLRLKLSSGKEIHYFDQRKFGRLWVTNNLSKLKGSQVSELGIDALDSKLTEKLFIQKIRSKKRQMKVLLLDQTLIAGLGNIYVDEALYLAKIHPLALSSKVPDSNLKILFKSMRKVLNDSLKYQGTTFRDYRTARGEEGGFFARLNVYGRKNQKCKRCGHVISKIKVAQRGTHLCLVCQIKFSN